MADNDQKGCITVGEGVVMKGSFVIPDKAFVNGEVEGEIVAREIFIGQTGKVKGKVVVDLADVRGELLDSLTAKKSLTLRSTGKIVGVVEYLEIEIEKGGEVQGKLLQVGTPPKLG